MAKFYNVHCSQCKKRVEISVLQDWCARCILEKRVADTELRWAAEAVLRDEEEARAPKRDNCVTCGAPYKWRAMPGGGDFWGSTCGCWMDGEASGIGAALAGACPSAIDDAGDDSNE